MATSNPSLVEGLRLDDKDASGVLTANTFVKIAKVMTYQEVY